MTQQIPIPISDPVSSAVVDWKDSVRAASGILLIDNASITGTPVYNAVGGASLRGQITATLAVSGVFTVDGVTMSSGERMAVGGEYGGTAEVHSVDTVADVSGSLNDTFFVFYTQQNWAFYVWYNVNAAGSDPAPSAPAGATYTGIEVALATDDTADTVASATKSAIDAFDFTGMGNSPTVGVSTNELTITNAFGGAVPNVADGASATGFTFGTDTPGTGLGSPTNGVYSVTIAGTTLTLDRTADFDEDTDVTRSAAFLVDLGASFAQSLFGVVAADPITVGGAAGSPMAFEPLIPTVITNHNDLGNLTAGDVHTHYANINGRVGGQTIIGGTEPSDELTLTSTSDGTLGRVRLGDGNEVVADEVNGRVGIGTLTPAAKLDVTAVNSGEEAIFGDGAGAGDLRPFNTSNGKIGTATKTWLEANIDTVKPDLLTFRNTVAPSGLGDVGVDLATGRPRWWDGSAVQDAIHAEDVPTDDRTRSIAVSPSNTVNEYFFAPYALTIVGVRAYCHSGVTTAGAYTLAVEDIDGSNNLLSAATFDLTALVAATLTTVGLTATGADLDLVAGTRVRCQFISDNADLVAEGVYFQLLFRAQ
jgi:hypothetical protein